MTVVSPSQRGLYVEALLRFFVLLICACFTQTLAFGAFSERSARGTPINSRTNVVKSMRAQALAAVRPYQQLPAQDRLGKDVSSIRDRQTAAVEETKLVDAGLLDVVSDALSLLPLWKTVGEGETLTLSVELDHLTVSLQWYFNGQPLEGQTRSLLTIHNVGSDNVGHYQLRATLAGTTLVSVPTDVQINETDGIVDRNVAAFDRLADTISLLQKAKAGQTSSAKSGAPARGFTGSQVFSTIGSGKESGEPNHCGVSGGASEWFAWQPPTNGTAVVTTDGSNFDTVLAIYEGPGNSYGTLTNVACDNDSGANGKTSRATFQARAGTTYYIAVDGVNGASGTVKLSYAVGAPPTITSQPASRTAALGMPAVLSVGALASPTARYQWTFNGAKIQNATNASFNLAAVSQTNLGAYRVCVTNSIGSTWSLKADLLLEAPLHISNQRISEDGFRLAIHGPAGTNYVVDSSTNLVHWTAIHTNRAQTGLFEFIDSVTPGSCSFYRVRISP